MKHSYNDYVPIFKALADETRLKIIDMLSNTKMCACGILEEFNITQPTLSYHMKILTEAGLVTGVRNGAWMWYSLNESKKEELKLFLTELMQQKETMSEEICSVKNKRNRG